VDRVLLVSTTLTILKLTVDGDQLVDQPKLNLEVVKSFGHGLSALNTDRSLTPSQRIVESYGTS
jgi:hypothetical protein